MTDDVLPRGTSAGATTTPRAGGRGPRGWWRRRRRRTKIVFAVLIAVFVLGVVGVAGAVYALTRIPLPDQVAEPQTVTVDYANGAPMFSTGANRQDVALSAVPVPVQHAVLAAEDRNFYSEPGVSITGMLRAAWTDLRGGTITEGGSTITQQYAKNAYLTQQRTFTRKFKDIVLAIKLSHRYSKAQILDDYLNTIYFGRGTYGIGAAAESYFGVPVQRLTVAQGMVLAGLIRAPSYLDPRVSPVAAQQRFAEVKAAMVRQKWLSPAQAAVTSLPPTLSPAQVATSASLTGPEYYINQRIDAELEADGMSAQQIQLGGFTVVTTLDRTSQAAAQTAIRSAPGGTISSGPKGLREGLVAVQPGTGAIKAYYAGATPGGVDLVSSPAAAVPPGSTMKAIVLAAALTNGIPLQTSYSGASPQVFPGNPTPIHNDADQSFGSVDLVTGMALSVNTVYVHLGLAVGEAKVAAMAHRLGLPPVPAADQVEDQPLGQAPSVTPLQMAQVYATFAAGGVTATPYLVARVLDHHGQVMISHTPQVRRVLSASVSDQVTYALSQVLQYGTASGTPLAGGRPAAGKTGTTDNNKSAWFDGFTPQLASVVDLWDYGPPAGDPQGPAGLQPLTGIDGYSLVYGADIPAHVWAYFMDLALANAPMLPLPALPVVPSAPPTYQPSYQPTYQPTYQPSPSPPPSVVPTSPTTPAPTASSSSKPAPTGSSSSTPPVTSSPTVSVTTSP